MTHANQEANKKLIIYRKKQTTDQLFKDLKKSQNKSLIFNTIFKQKTTD
jgi:hypothetical protein